MGKAPAFQFYVKDWLTDPELRLASISTRGIWIDLLCYMWQSGNRGKLSVTPEQIVKLTGAKNGEVELFLSEAEKYRFCDIFVTHNGVSQIYNRRMYRDAKVREQGRLRQKKWREKNADNAEITPLSPSPSPSPLHIYDQSFEKFWEKYPNKVGKKYAYKCWKNATDKPGLKKIIEAVERQCEWPRWKKNNGEFIPNPAKWIKEGRWDDGGVTIKNIKRKPKNELPAWMVEEGLA